MVHRRVVIGLFFAGLACQVPAPPPPRDLIDGAQILREMMSPRKLNAAGFLDSYPNPKPSDFVGYINSEMGMVLWPPREDSPFADDIELKQSRAIGETVLPKGVAYRRNRPDPDGGHQIVYRADDESGEVIVEAYTDPAAAPIFTRRWKLPH